jgi:copper chaperone NosL
MKGPETVKYTLAFFVIINTVFTSCNVKPVPLKLGVDNCDYCKMTVSDLHFGAELITQKGKLFIFDDPHCILSFIKEKKVEPSEIKDVYLSDYSGNHEMVNIKDVHLYRSEELRSPMGGNIAVFLSIDSLVRYMGNKKGERVIWDDLVK